MSGIYLQKEVNVSAADISKTNSMGKQQKRPEGKHLIFKVKCPFKARPVCALHMESSSKVNLLQGIFSLTRSMFGWNLTNTELNIFGGRFPFKLASYFRVYPKELNRSK